MKKDLRWWLTPKDEAHEEVKTAFDQVRDLDEDRQSSMLKYLRMYGGKRQVGMAASPTPAIVGPKERLRLNVIRNCVDAISSKMTKIKTAPQFITQKGDYSKYSQAKDLSLYCNGVFYQNKLYREGIKCFRDGAVLGTGAAKVYGDAENKRVVVERVYPFELYVDPREALYGDPRTLYQARPMDRKVLQELYPKKQMEIAEADAFVDQDIISSGVDEHPDQVLVIEAWHLPSSKKAKDGRHVLVVSNTTLVDEEWIQVRFPFAFLRWSEPVVGFWGTGAAEELYSIQLEINQLLQHVQASMRLGSSPTVFLPRNSKINPSHISNELFNIIETSGAPYDVKVYGTVHPEIFQQIDRLYERAYNIIGISQLSAQSTKPAGLDSGRGLLVYNDIESERFQVTGENFQHWYMDVADLIISTSRELMKSDVDISVRASVKNRSNKFIRSIKWSDVNLDDDAFEMQMMPVSSLPSRPEGRQTVIERWMQNGFIDKTQAMALMEMPDTDGFANLELAAYDSVMSAMESIIDNGVFISPEPFDDLTLCIKLAGAVYRRARLDGVPEDRLKLLRQYISAAESLLPAPPPEMTMPPGVQ